MIPIFVLSLSDCKSRREKIAQHLNNLSLPFEFLNAVDGRRGLSKGHESLIDRSGATESLSYPLADTEFGCALSHIQAYRRIVDHCIPYAMILEDDAIPQQDLPQFIARRHYEASDLTSLFYSQTYIRPDRATLLFDGYKSYPCEPGIPVRGAAGYIASLDAARHILQNALPVISVSDWPTCTEHFKAQKRWNLIHPRLVNHARRSEHGQTSIIGPSRHRRKRRFLGLYVPPWNRVVQSCKWQLTYRSLGFRKISW